MIEAIIAMGVIGWALIACAIIALFGSVIKFKSNGGISFVWFLVFVGLAIAIFKDPLLTYSQAYVSPEGIRWGKIGSAVLELGLYWLIGGIVTGFFYWLSLVKDVSNEYNARRISFLSKLKNGESITGSDKWTERALTVASKVLAVGTHDSSVFKAFGDSGELSVPNELRPILHEADMSLDNMFAAIDWSSTTEDVGPAPVQKAVPDSNDWTSARAREQATKEFKAATIRYQFAKASVQADMLDKLEASVREILPPRAGSFKAAILYSAVVWPVTALSLIFADMLRHLWDWFFERARAFFDMCSIKTFGEV